MQCTSAYADVCEQIGCWPDVFDPHEKVFPGAKT